MPTRNGFEQCFNAQAAVDATAQVVVACDDFATGRQKPGTKAATHAKNGKPGSLVARMRERLQRGGWRSPYRLWKQVVEPVTGHTSGPGPIQAEALSVEHKQV